MTHVPLHKNVLFQLSIFIPLVLGIVVAALIAWAEPARGICFSSECFSHALTTFQLPITLMALAVPLAGIAAAVHRSVEAQHQIQLAIDNNTFSNYTKHRDDFFDLIERTEDIYPALFKFGNPSRLYSRLFPENWYDRLTVKIDTPPPILAEVRQYLDQTADILKQESFTREDLFEYFRLLDAGHHALGIVVTDPNSTPVKYDGQFHEFIGGNELEVINRSVLLFSYSRIHFFCTRTNPNPLIEATPEDYTRLSKHRHLLDLDPN